MLSKAQRAVRGCCAVMTQGSAAAGTGHDIENAAALSDALLVMTIVPWTLCVLCYCGLHFTYAADREAAQVVPMPVANVLCHMRSRAAIATSCWNAAERIMYSSAVARY